MRIYAKRALQFDHPAGQEPAVVVQSRNFADVPDWVKESTMFKWASESEDVTIVESAQDEKKVEKPQESEELKALRERAKELGIASAHSMKEETLQAKIAEKEAELQAASEQKQPREGGNNQPPTV